MQQTNAVQKLGIDLLEKYALYKLDPGSSKPHFKITGAQARSQI